MIWRNEETIWRGRYDLKRHDLVFRSKNEEEERSSEERFKARSKETKRRFEEEDQIWRGTIWSKNEEEEWRTKNDLTVKLEFQKLDFQKSKLKNSIFILELEF